MARHVRHSESPRPRRSALLPRRLTFTPGQASGSLPSHSSSGLDHHPQSGPSRGRSGSAIRPLHQRNASSGAASIGHPHREEARRPLARRARRATRTARRGRDRYPRYERAARHRRWRRIRTDRSCRSCARTGRSGTHRESPPRAPRYALRGCRAGRRRRDRDRRLARLRAVASTCWRSEPHTRVVR